MYAAPLENTSRLGDNRSDKIEYGTSEIIIHCKLLIINLQCLIYGFKPRTFSRKKKMEYVWVKCDTEDDIGLVFGARIVERLRNRFKIRDDNGNESYVKYSDLLRPMHPSCIKDVDDMILLGDLQEYTILRNLELRYMKNLIYVSAAAVD